MKTTLLITALVGSHIFGCATSNTAVKPAPAKIETKDPALIEAEKKWHNLIDTGDDNQAKTYCESLLTSENEKIQAEGHKCLANVALMGDNPAAFSMALDHLNEGLKLSEQDLSIHQGRLHLLRMAKKIPEMVEALNDSCRTYKGDDALETWLAYTQEFFADMKLDEAIALLVVLEKRYPDSHKVLANIGAVYAIAEENELALEYTLNAVKLAPDDPINTWNLARLYDFTDKSDLANQWYEKAIKLETDPETKVDKQCRFGSFIKDKLNDKARGCELILANCPEDGRADCI